MGLLDGQRARHEAAREVAAASVAGCHNPATHYVTEVNRGSVNMAMLAGGLNVQYGKGYRLAQAFEQGGNIVMIFEHNHA